MQAVGGAPSAQAATQTPANIVRLWGTTAIDTSIDISGEWAAGSTTYAVIATGRSFPDALAGVPLAYALNAPILLTGNAKSGLEAGVKDELARLRVTHVIILGGTAAIRSSIQTDLKKKYTVERLGGTTCYDTAVLIAKKLKQVRKAASTPLVFLVDGTHYPDASSVSPVAARLGAPIVFGSGSTKALNSSTKKYLTTEKPATIHVIGGTSAVSQKAMDDAWAAANAKTVTRIAGTTLYDTNVSVFRQWRSLFSSGGAITLATGRNFPDALTGGVLAAKLKAPLFLVDGQGTTINADVRAAATSLAADTAYIFGGALAVTDDMASGTVIVDATNPAPPPPPTSPYIQTVTSKQFVVVQAPSGHSVIEGTTTDGTYIYAAYAKSGATVPDIALRKFDMKGNVLNTVVFGNQLGNANDITYNPKTRQLVVAAMNQSYVIVDPSTLKIISTGSAGRGFDNVCYNSSTDQYVANGYLFDGTFKYLKTIYTTGFINGVLGANIGDPGIVGQGIYCDNQYIYAMRSAADMTANIAEHTRIAQVDWSGKAVAAYDIPLRAEAEAMFMMNGALYVVYNRGVYSGGVARDDFIVKVSLGSGAPS